MSESTAPAFEFAQVIALKIDDGWHYVAGARQALECLNSEFPDIDAPSAKRAIAAVEAFLAGKGPENAARITFVVAAMEAGFKFEAGVGTELMEEHLTEAAEASLRGLTLDDIA